MLTSFSLTSLASTATFVPRVYAHGGSMSRANGAQLSFNAFLVQEVLVVSHTQTRSRTKDIGTRAREIRGYAIRRRH